MSEKAKQARLTTAEQLQKLLVAVEGVYYSAVWSADRPVDEAFLWKELRDAAGFVPGQSPAPIPFEGVRTTYSLNKIRQLGGTIWGSKASGSEFDTEKARAFLLLHGTELRTKLDTVVREFLEEKLS